MKISKKQAAQFILFHQNLLPPRKIQDKAGIHEFVRRVGCIQYDPLDMVGYNPNLVLQSRVHDYKPEYLHELLYTDRKLVDGFDKNLAIYAVEDWPYFSLYREKARLYYGGENRPICAILPEVREEIVAKGPVSSSDLKFDEKVDWAWAPTRGARAALESMYFWGELIIQRKVGTRKFYDFATKYLSAELLNAPNPFETMEQYYEWNVKRRIGAIGLLWNRPSDAWLGVLKMKSKERNEAFSNLLERGEILPVEVEGVKNPVYMCKEGEPLLVEVLNGINFEPQMAFLAPLDNLLWDRKLIKEIFDFEYVWEVYKPVIERKYGYYVLPVLYGDRFVARFEPKFDKKSKQLEVLNWWWEPGVVVTEEMNRACECCFAEFVHYLGAGGVKLQNNVEIALKVSK